MVGKSSANSERTLTWEGSKEDSFVNIDWPDFAKIFVLNLFNMVKNTIISEKENENIFHVWTAKFVLWNIFLKMIDQQSCKSESRIVLRLKEM